MRYIALALCLALPGCVSVRQCRRYAEMKRSTGYLEGLNSRVESLYRRTDCQMEILERTVELDAKQAACEAVLERYKKSLERRNR